MSLELEEDFGEEENERRRQIEAEDLRQRQVRLTPTPMRLLAQEYWLQSPVAYSDFSVCSLL
jgi:hypothetical protein